MGLTVPLCPDDGAEIPDLEPGSGTSSAEVK